MPGSLYFPPVRFIVVTDLFRAYTLPDRYANDVPVDLVVCDSKVDPDLVERIRSSVEDGDKVKAIVVIKHPKQGIYAVLDGHHRFHALRSTGATTVRAAVVDDYIGLGFKLTKSGKFQPSPEFTRLVRVPLKRFLACMERFLRDPNKVLAEQLEGLKSRSRGPKDR
jgi:hypothetical protein